MVADYLWVIVLENNGVPKTGSSAQYILSFDFFTIPLLNVRPDVSSFLPL
jgi:hypothetical protein